MDLEALNKGTQAAWNQNAEFWDEKMGEGNLFQRVLVGPTIERLLELKPGELVLEIACGNGVFARRLAQLGAQVIATDFSQKLLEQAQKRSVEYIGRIEYLFIDATNEEQLLKLRERHFDAVVCNMAIMDIATIEPLMSALSRLLKVDGRFIFSVMHPCFNNPKVKLGMEEEDRDGEIITKYYVRSAKYIDIPPQKGLAIIGQPVPHYYFHRPLNVLFNSCFQAGFVINGLEEPTFGPEDFSTRSLSWANFKDIPPVLVVRCKLSFPEAKMNA
jgi:2-polyprenyl-3-methyl-5-hydroxy-6-metoxy-1,4-benzoquinol methylase